MKYPCPLSICYVTNEPREAMKECEWCIFDEDNNIECGYG
jgi:hypothetical protein